MGQSQGESGPSCPPRGCGSAPEWPAGGGATDVMPTVTSHARVIPQFGPNITIYCILTVLPTTKKERQDYAFWRQLDEKPSIMPRSVAYVRQTTCRRATEDKSTAWNHGAQHLCRLEAACLPAMTAYS